MRQLACGFSMPKEVLQVIKRIEFSVSREMYSENLARIFHEHVKEHIKEHREH
jgi:hypothetical protein